MYLKDKDFRRLAGKLADAFPPRQTPTAEQDDGLRGRFRWEAGLQDEEYRFDEQGNPRQWLQYEGQPRMFLMPSGDTDDALGAQNVRHPRAAPAVTNNDGLRDRFPDAGLADDSPQDRGPSYNPAADPTIPPASEQPSGSVLSREPRASAPIPPLTQREQDVESAALRERQELELARRSIEDRRLRQAANPTPRPALPPETQHIVAGIRGMPRREGPTLLDFLESVAPALVERFWNVQPPQRGSGYATEDGNLDPSQFDNAGDYLAAAQEELRRQEELDRQRRMDDIRRSREIRGRSNPR